MIVVFGAGAVGCFLGGLLAAKGHDVMLVGRSTFADKLNAGFWVAPYGAAKRPIPMDKITIVSALPAHTPAEMILVCVKSGDTAQAATEIAAADTGAAPVISLQNGLTNVDVLSQHIDPVRVVAGMVAFNVIESQPGTFMQATQGDVVLGKGGARLAQMLSTAWVAAKVSPNMRGVQWSKLMLNLNNALNMLSGIGLKAQLEDRAWRHVFAACIAEGLAVARAEGVALERIGKVHPKMLPMLLRLPNFIFYRLANSMLAIDPAARTSMVTDYELGRKTEVDWLNGHIVKRAAFHGIKAPVNAAVTQAVKDAFSKEERGALSVRPTDLMA